MRKTHAKRGVIHDRGARNLKSVSIVWQMRIVGAMVLLSVIALLVLGISGLRLIKDSQSQLTDGAIPSLARVVAFDTGATGQDGIRIGYCLAIL